MGLSMLAVPPRVRDYLSAFDLAAVFVSRERVVVARPREIGRLRDVPDEAIWWGPAATAEALQRACEAERAADIIGTATLFNDYAKPLASYSENNPWGSQWQL